MASRKIQAIKISARKGAYETASDVSMETILETVKLEECAKIVNKHYDGTAMIDDSMMCAQDQESGSCLGDSGGPLVAYDKTNTTLYLYGVVSYGYII